MAGPDGPQILVVDDPRALPEVIRALRVGLLVALPTETVYGLACARAAGPLRRLVAAKVRPPDKGITLLVDGLDQVEELVIVSEVARRLAKRFWPGPLTLVLPLRPGTTLPALVTGGGREVGLRMPDQPFTRSVARALGPLPLTSANRSGAAEALSAAEVVAAVGGSVAVIVDGGPSPGGVPSTVVNLAGDPTDGLRIIRRGALPAELIDAVAAGRRVHFGRSSKGGGVA